MSTRIYRPGSMGAAEKKSRRNMLIGIGVVYVLILALFLLIPSYPKDWSDRAGAFCKFLGIVFVTGSYAVLVYAEDLWPRKPHVASWVAFVILVLAVCIFAGFNFDFIGIANRP